MAGFLSETIFLGKTKKTSLFFFSKLLYAAMKPSNSRLKQGIGQIERRSLMNRAGSDVLEQGIVQGWNPLQKSTCS